MLIDGNLDGKVLIDGSLKNVCPAEEIKVAGSMSAAAGITVDYDGWQTGDDWDAGATILIGSITYTESAAAVNDVATLPNLWHITSCIGDCDNNGLLDSFDIEPFLDILFDQPKYALDHPGLVGSMIYHGDSDCDGDVDSFDIDPFLAKIFCATPPCCDCAFRIGGGRIVAITLFKTALIRRALGVAPSAGQCDPQADRIIDSLTTYAAPRHYANLLNTCAYLAAYYGEVNDPQRSRMWLSVYDALSANFAG